MFNAHDCFDQHTKIVVVPICSGLNELSVDVHHTNNEQVLVFKGTCHVDFIAKNIFRSRIFIHFTVTLNERLKS